LYGIAVTLNHGSMGYTYEAGEEAVQRLRGVQSAILADSSMRPRRLFVRKLAISIRSSATHMQATNLTTTLSELNRLYGEYFDATEGANPDVENRPALDRL